mmetsp:Transcript_56038/g.111244  ORF Transcript_56038/g.111244 Transcript_56038/m.111244 type:complete len:279 (-) Transcript_56038:144-980(-)
MHVILLLSSLSFHTAMVPRPAIASLGTSRQRHCCVALVENKEEMFKLLEELDQETKAAAELRKATMGADVKVAPLDNKVSMFGARLDEDVAGQEFSRTKAREEYEILFDTGVLLMKRGEYKEAVTAFTRATAQAPGGLTGRKGGQYAIYLAQALQAANRKKEAVGLLKRCEAHPDGDVRKIADSVLYIMQAPELKLDEDMFLKITPLEEKDDWNRRRAPQQQKDPPPEKYSIEWYILEAEKRKRDTVTQSSQAAVGPALLACGAILVGSAGLLLLKQS